MLTQRTGGSIVTITTALASSPVRLDVRGRPHGRAAGQVPSLRLESAEGSIWEAFDKASYYKLGNLTAILDMNRLGQRGETDLGWNSAAYAARAHAFGWNVVELDGHDLTSIDNAYAAAKKEKSKPTVLVAKTVRGSGVALVANKDGWHGKALGPDQAKEAIAELGGERKIVIQSPKPEKAVADRPMTAPALDGPSYALGGKEATRKAYGDAITALVRGKRVTVEDHWPEGGLGDAVLEALAAQPLNNLRVVKLAVKDMPGSGTPDELMRAAGIDADAIIEAVKSLV